MNDSKFIQDLSDEEEFERARQPIMDGMEDLFTEIETTPAVFISQSLVVIAKMCAEIGMPSVIFEAQMNALKQCYKINMEIKK